MANKCDHNEQIVKHKLSRFSQNGQDWWGMLDVRIECAKCGIPFHFKGLPYGIDMHGAARSPDATEARLAVGAGHIAFGSSANDEQRH